jgi:hypothetical protein
MAISISMAMTIRNTNKKIQTPINRLSLEFGFFKTYFSLIQFLIAIVIAIEIDSFLSHQINNFPWNNNHLVWRFSFQLFDGSFVFHNDFLDFFFG